MKHAPGIGSKLRPERLLIEQIKVFAPAVEMIQWAGKARGNENRVSIDYTGRSREMSANSFLVGVLTHGGCTKLKF